MPANDIQVRDDRRSATIARPTCPPFSSLTHLSRRRAGQILGALAAPLALVGALGTSPPSVAADELHVFAGERDEARQSVHTAADSNDLTGRSSPLASDASTGVATAREIDAFPAMPEFFGTLRADHPRLILTTARVGTLRALVATDATARSQFVRLAQVGQRILDMPVGPRASGASAATRTVPGIRRTIDRMTCLALLHVIDGDGRWSDRAALEMRALADVADWSPTQIARDQAAFLDAAETTGALALGYDWLYGVLDRDIRTAVRAAIAQKGLRAIDEAFRLPASWASDGSDLTAAWSATAILGALAIAEDEPDLAHVVASHAVSALPITIASYATDGAWPDGPAYWDASTGALAMAGAALETAIGTDLALCKTPAIVNGLAYRLHVTGPFGLVFNYADCQDRTDIDPAVEWLGQRAGDAWVVEEARARAGASVRPFSVAWYRREPVRATTTRVVAPPLDRWFPDAGVVCMRSAWHDPEAIFCAAKGGDSSARHAHLDLGTFVLDALGERWAMDLGPDEYGLPEYFGRKRFSYYRTRTEGHNTLVIDGQNQDAGARAPITAFATAPSEVRSVIDLGAAYASSGATRVVRGVGLIDGRRRVIVQDEISLRPARASTTSADVAWAMHTQADVQVDLASGGRVAFLIRGRRRVEATILSPENSWFAVEVVAAPAPQRRIEGVRKLTVQLPPSISGGTGSSDNFVRIVVVFTPEVSENAPSLMPPVLPLEAWVGAGTD